MFLEDKKRELKAYKFMGLIKDHLKDSKINSEDFVYIYSRFVEVVNKVIEIKKRDDNRGEILQK